LVARFESAGHDSLASPIKFFVTRVTNRSPL